MLVLTEKTTKEISGIHNALISAKDRIENSYRSLLEEFNNDAFTQFMETIENDLEYNFTFWIKREVDRLMEGLLSGDMAYLKHTAIVSEYSWDKLQKIRLAIYEAAKDPVLEAALVSARKEIQDLREHLSGLQDDYARYRRNHE